VFGPFGLSIEVQIRTTTCTAWPRPGGGPLAVQERRGQRGQLAPARLNWLRDLLAIQSEAGNANEFLDHLKVDLFPGRVYVFTPNGDIRKLPRGATVVDFAYGRAYRHRRPVRRPPRSITCWCRCAPCCANGDHVEILTSKWGRRARPGSTTWCQQGARPRAPLPQEPAARRVGAARCAADGEGIRRSEHRHRPARRRAQAELLKGSSSRIGTTCSPTSVSATAWRRWWPMQLQPAAAGAAVRDTAVQLAIRGTEGVVVTYARCCRPIPVTRSSASCRPPRHHRAHRRLPERRQVPQASRAVDRGQVEARIEGVFPVNVRVEVKNQRGVLAQVAAGDRARVRRQHRHRQPRRA